MENVTLGQISTILAFIVALIGSIEYLYVRMKKWFKSALNEELKPIIDDLKNIKDDLNNETLSRCKSDLIAIMSRIQAGYKPTLEEKRLLYETKEKYNSLGGDSYVDDMFDDLKKKGLI